MKTVKFKKNGGELSIEIKSGYAQPGAYSVILWEANENKIIGKYKGNFINSSDDKYSLPVPVESNNNRVLDCLAYFVITPPINDYNLEMIASQDGTQIGSESYSGSTETQTVSVKLYIQLEGE